MGERQSAAPQACYGGELGASKQEGHSSEGLEQRGARRVMRKGSFGRVTERFTSMLLWALATEQRNNNKCCLLQILFAANKFLVDCKSN